MQKEKIVSEVVTDGFGFDSFLSFHFRRTISGASATSSYSGAGAAVHDEFDRAMQDISQDLENMQMSVNVDSSANSDSFLPKTTWEGLNAVWT